jgi:ribosomal protein S20
LAKTPRGWTGARTPSAIKRVRQAERRRAINQPRKSAAKTYAANAIKVATGASEGDTASALAEAMSALDKAAKVGAIHPNNAARRKSRLVLRLNALADGTAVQTTRSTKSTGTAAAIKAARTRIASGKATKAKGPQTAAGKAKAALSRTARTEIVPVAAVTAAPKAATKAPAKVAAKAEKPAAKAPAKAPAKAAAKAPAKAAAAPKAAAKAEKPAPKATKAPAKTPAKAEKPAPKAEKKPKKV